MRGDPISRLEALVLDDLAPEDAARRWAGALDLDEARSFAEVVGRKVARRFAAEVESIRERDRAEAIDGMRGRKLGPPEVRAIRGALADGERQREVAARFGVSQAAVSAIATGQRWGSVR